MDATGIADNNNVSTLAYGVLQLVRWIIIIIITALHVIHKSASAELQLLEKPTSS